MDAAPAPPIDEETARKLALGAAAARTLADPELSAANELLKRFLHEQWETCQAPAVRENLWQRLNGLNAARGQLQEHVAVANDARQRIEAADAQRQKDAARQAAGRPPLTR